MTCAIPVRDPAREKLRADSWRHMLAAAAAFRAGVKPPSDPPPSPWPAGHPRSR